MNCVASCFGSVVYKALSAAPPEQIPELLPRILNSIRLIWNFSRFYNTPERMTGLLGKLSNEIINRCCAVINLEDIFSGEVDTVMATLRQSIKAGEQWKQVNAVSPVSVYLLCKLTSVVG